MYKEDLRLSYKAYLNAIEIGGFTLKRRGKAITTRRCCRQGEDERRESAGVDMFKELLRSLRKHKIGGSHPVQAIFSQLSGAHSQRHPRAVFGRRYPVHGA